MLDTQTFVSAIKFVSHAMPSKDIRFYLNGVFLEIKDTGIHFVATDGHRAAVAFAHHTIPFDGEYIISAESVKQIISLFGKDKIGEITFTQDGRGLAISSIFGATYKPEIIDGKYPDWRRIDCDDNRARGAMPGINADYLADACKALKDVAVKGSFTPIEINAADEGLTVKLRIAKEVKGAPSLKATLLGAFALIAPVRKDK